MDFRKTYDRIPEEFDRWRPRYCPELFAEVIGYAGLGTHSAALEIGPGTGQATEPFLRCGCNYLAVELGERFVDFMKRRFGGYDNFHIVHGDFETCELGQERFDLVFSAATIQWIPEAVAFSKSFRLLKSGGALAMFMTRTDDRSANPELYEAIERVYEAHFHVETKYTCKLDYTNAVNYGFTDFHYQDWKNVRIYTAEEYVQYLAATQVEHITLQEPYRSRFFDGVRQAVLAAGDRIELRNTIALYLAKKP
ncbi:MAG: class I SAM-dependent methyltransferase [Eubacteriales bacterium]|nr:class I SAM-dependent methyltransferase [Eubacteriales bacterium]